MQPIKKSVFAGREVLSYVGTRTQEAKTVELGGKFASGVLVLWSRFEGIRLMKFIGVLLHICRTSDLAESILPLRGPTSALLHFTTLPSP